MGASKGSLKPAWLADSGLTTAGLRPYVLLHPTHQRLNSGQRHKFNWFDQDPLVIDPLRLENADFANHVRFLDELMFGGADLGMARWVFYDCAILPGLVAGFAAPREKLHEDILKVLKVPPTLKWVPLSLFIIIPMIRPGHWMAHNLCSVNDLLTSKDMRFKGLGFLSKAFGLWYADVEYLFGVTQWLRPALKLHANYGYLEVVTAYTPLHTYAESLTYRMRVDSSHWLGFFDRKFSQSEFSKLYKSTGFMVEPKSEKSLISLQEKIERGGGPFVLSGKEILTKEMGEPLELYRPI